VLSIDTGAFSLQRSHVQPPLVSLFWPTTRLLCQFGRQISLSLWRGFPQGCIFVFFIFLTFLPRSFLSFKPFSIAHPRPLNQFSLAEFLAVLSRRANRNSSPPILCLWSRHFYPDRKVSLLPSFPSSTLLITHHEPTRMFHFLTSFFLPAVRFAFQELRFPFFLNFLSHLYQLF